MRNQFVGAAVGATLLLAHVVSAQSNKQRVEIPLRELSAPEVQTLPQFASIASVRELSTGKVMVNDSARRQLLMFDHPLVNAVVALDSAAMTSRGYARWMSGVRPFAGDSSLFADELSGTLVILDGEGKIGRQQRVQNRTDLLYLSNSRGADAKGNVVYPIRFEGMTAAERNTAILHGKQYATVARMNLQTMTATRVGKVQAETQLGTETKADATGVSRMVATINPLAQSDDWTVLADGSIALLFGLDYHVEITQPNGRALAATSLPFAWRTLNDTEKKVIVDSVTRVRTAELDDLNSPIVKLAAASSGMSRMYAGGIVSLAPGSGFSLESHRDSSGDNVIIASKSQVVGIGEEQQVHVAVQRPVIESVPLGDMHNVYPAFLPNAMKADADNRVWIRTTTTLAAHPGDALYDVLNNRGELVQRVHVPADRTIVGFGRGGVVYLKHLDGPQQWVLERVKVMQ